MNLLGNILCAYAVLFLCVPSGIGHVVGAVTGIALGMAASALGIYFGGRR